MGRKSQLDFGVEKAYRTILIESVERGKKLEYIKNSYDHSCTEY